MPAPNLEKRVENLENAMNGPGGVLERLDTLSMDLAAFRGEFLQFRDETRAEFSALREDLRSEFRQELRSESQELRSEIGAVRQQLSREIDTVRNELGGLRTHMLVLHEEIISRLTLLHEGLSRRG